MQIRHLKVNNFRGIASLDWYPGGEFCCLVGAGDSGKTTILDAIEAALSSRWFSFSEPDFFNGDTSEDITIEATVGELSRQLKSDERLGLYIRGWTAEGELRDEPEEGDEPVLTVRLTVDSTMEPVWQIVCDRLPDPRILSNRDRALFGVLRLSGDDPRHLTWGQSSVLSRLTENTDEAATRLAEAYSSARESAKLHEIKVLTDAAEIAEKYSKGLGAYVDDHYLPGLELGRSGLSSGSIALHDGSTPLRLAGLGTRRLATLAIQKSAISEGAVVLVDEIEHGLEPHRIIGAISQLQQDQKQSRSEENPTGQVVLTTHSPVALGHSGVGSLRVVNMDRSGRQVSVVPASSADSLRSLLRFMPEAFFARRILVAEGSTEVGLLLKMREVWPENHDDRPLEQVGAAIADGNGEQAPALALSLASLGYPVGLYVDSDKPLDGPVRQSLEGAGVSVVEYGGGLNTEQAIISAATDDEVQGILEHVREILGADSVNESLRHEVGDVSVEVIRSGFEEWSAHSAKNGAELRVDISTVALRQKWIKSRQSAYDFAPHILSIIKRDPESPLALTLASVEIWLYG